MMKKKKRKLEGSLYGEAKSAQGIKIKGAKLGKIKPKALKSKTIKC